MSLVFESLGELSTYVAEHGIEIVDPGVPLEDLTVSKHDLWATQPSVRKVVGFIARNVSSVPLHVYERVSDTDRRRVRDHELARLMKTPAPRTPSARFWELVMIDWLLHDRWCVRKVPTENGTIELVRIPPRLWRFRADGLDRIVAVQFRVDGRWVDNDPDQFIFDHGYARVGANGTSPARTLRTLLEEAAEAVEYRRSVWRNGARVPTVIERPNDAPSWSPEARSRFKRAWANFVRGGGQEGGTPILEDGMKLVAVDAFKPVDTGDLEGRRLTDIEVATAYYIAPELLGIREGTYSNVESFRQALYRDALGPYIAQWEQALNAMLTPDLAGDRDLYVEAHVDAKLRGSFEEQAKIISTSTGAPWLTRNEARARANLPAIDGADELVTPLNVIVGGLASPRDTAPKQRRAVKALEPELAPVAKEVAALEQDLAAYQGRLREDLERSLDLKAPPSLVDAFDLARWNMTLAAILAARSRRIAQSAAGEVLDKWNPERDGWDPDVMDPWLLKAAQSNAARANQRIYDDIAAALMTGDSWRDAARAVLEADGFATVWARTLGTEAASFGRNDAAQASGLTTKTWRTTSSNPRASHSALSGTTVQIGETFSNGARWPGDWQAGAAEVVNCTCRLDYSPGDA